MKQVVPIKTLKLGTHFKTTLTNRLGMVTGRSYVGGVAVEFFNPVEAKDVHPNLLVIPLDDIEASEVDSDVIALVA